jgi:hypothetical protein
MVHRASSVVVALVLVLAMPAPGWARDKRDFWGWLERLSGPGPFTPKGVPTVGLRPPVCWNGRERISLTAATRGSACLFADLGRWESQDDRLLGSDVTLTTFDAGVTFPVAFGIEMGAGLGLYKFSTDLEDPTRLTLVPGRLVVKPLQWTAKAFGVADDSRAMRRWGAFKVYYKTSVILGVIESADFGPDLPYFREKNEAISSWGFLVDLLEFLP